MLIDKIDRVVRAVRADEVKGGGDPADVAIIEAELKRAALRLCRHIEKMRQDAE